MNVMKKSLISAAILFAAGGCQSALNADIQYLQSAPNTSFSSSESGAQKLYEAGQSALNERRWDDASKAFKDLIKTRSSHTDAAMYWHAYALHRSGKDAESVRQINSLIASYPNSNWSEQGEALRIEITGIEEPNEATDLKLFAVNSLMSVSAAKAVPVIKKTLASNASDEVKRAALFVLSQKRSPEATELLLSTASNHSDKKLQKHAIETLAISRNPGAIQKLDEVYRGSSDPEIKEAILSGFFIARDVERVLDVAKSEQDPAYRRKAIELLGVMKEKDALYSIYQSEQDPKLKQELIEALSMAGDERILDEALSSGDPKLIEKSIHLAVAFRQTGIYEKLASVYANSSDRGVKSAIIESYMIGRNIDSLAELLESETDTVLMEKIIEMLAVSRSQKASGVLRAKYAELSDNKLKAKILEGFMIQGDAKQLVSVFRNESDPKLKRKAVELLSVMRNAEAQEFMLSLLEDDSDA